MTAVFILGLDCHCLPDYYNFKPAGAPAPLCIILI